PLWAARYALLSRTFERSGVIGFGPFKRDPAQRGSPDGIRRAGAVVKITAIRLDRMRLPLVPPFRAAWDPVPRQAFGATLVRAETDEGVTGYGSGDTMDGFAAYEGLFLGRDPGQIARHVRTLETIGFHA